MEKKKSHIFYPDGGMQVPGLCASIYSVFYFKWRGTGLEQKGPISSEWIWVVTEKKSKRIELITMLCFFNAPVSHSPTTPLLPSFPTWLRQRGVSIGSPFSPRLPGLHQCFFLTSCFCLTFGLPPSIPLCSPQIFLSPFLFPSPFICPYPSPGKLTSKCEQSLSF